MALNAELHHHAHHLMSVIERKLAGGEGVIGIYGTMACASSETFLRAIHELTGLGKSSSLVDFGAGLGRLLLSAQALLGVRTCIGYELDDIKVMKAGAMISKVRNALAHDPHMPPDAPIVYRQNVATLDELPPGTTHVVAFWEGLNEHDMKAVGRLVSSTPMVTGIGIAQRNMHNPADRMLQLGFPPLELVRRHDVTMNGGKKFKAYIFKRL